MIEAIQHFHSRAVSSGAAPTAPTDNSAGFGNELESQLTLPDIRNIFGGGSASPAAVTPSNTPTTTPAAAAAPAQTPSAGNPPTAQSVFGDQPWMSDPQGSGPDGSTWDYNPIYFASSSTAAKIAQMVGGKVVEQNAITPSGGSLLQQTTMNEMVQLPNGSLINPGLVADFYDHGYSQNTINQMIANEVKGV